MKRFFKNIIRKTRKDPYILIGAISVVLFIFSFFISNNIYMISKERSRVERVVKKRIDILDKYSNIALESPSDEWLEIDNFPDDMVIYKYNSDILQSWINLFPIGVDDVFPNAIPYGLIDPMRMNFSLAPLNYLNNEEQYVNLGSKWYIVKIYEKIVQRESVKVISGLEIKTEYVNESYILENKVNPKLKLDKSLTTEPISTDNSNIIYSRNGTPLFSITPISTLINNSAGYVLRWIALFIAIAALFSYHQKKKSLSSLFITFIILTITRAVTFVMSKGMESTFTLFSPTLYADNGLFNSLGNFLLNNLYIFLCFTSLFISRRCFYRKYIKLNSKKQRISRYAYILIPLSIVTYIHLSLRSLILNSTIVMELYRLEEISVYTILAYLSYALLFISLFFSLQMMASLFGKRKRSNLFTKRGIAIFTILVSVYCLFTISSLGFKKETERNRIWTSKLSTNRDLELEVFLRAIENNIQYDPIIRRLINSPDGAYMILERLKKNQLLNIAQKYEIGVVVCGSFDTYLNLNCHRFFDIDVLYMHGQPLSLPSNFFFINDYSGIAMYVGSFSYPFAFDTRKLYITISNKLIKDNIGYPSLLYNSRDIDIIDMPATYSYAKYYDNRLLDSKGRFNYSVTAPQELEEGFSITRSEGFIHFCNKEIDGNVAIISRPKRTIVPYLVSLSYIVLFNLLILSILYMFGRKRGYETPHTMPKNSFRTKITYLMTGSMVFALICMGAGSVIFSLSIYNEGLHNQMEEKLYAVQTTFTEMFQTARSYREINTPEMVRALETLANNTQVDINVYAPHGMIIRSTRAEIYDQSIASSRMNPEAYHELIYNNKKQFINKESIASLKYYSLYASIFNRDGELITIINIPFFTNTSEFRQDASFMIATIINIYMLLLIVAFLGSRALASSMTKPLVDISLKMQGTDFINRGEPINYQNKDEIGVLVKAYNQMLKDLEYSKDQLAESEREQAWREMARQIAHEIKNPLTPMRLSIQHLIRLKENNVEGWEEKFDAIAGSILEQIDILTDTANEFSNFAQFYTENPAKLDLIVSIKEQCNLFDTRDNILFSLLYDTSPAYVLARKSQITRVFVNLISNAVQALENKRDGRIRITLTQINNSYQIEVEDNGAGVSKENLNKLFKPNFTTKSGGTGLGLAICRSIIEQSNGSMTYRKSEFGGANFVIILPIYTQEEEI